MLDEQEYAEAFRLYGECMKGAKEFRQQWNVPLTSASIRERFRPIRQWYEQLTGVPGCHENAIMHHRLSDFGNACRVCGSRSALHEQSYVLRVEQRSQRDKRGSNASPVRGRNSIRPVRNTRLRKDTVMHIAGSIGQPEIAPGVPISQLQVIETQ